jgi:cytochrome c oxidase subunit 2
MQNLFNKNNILILSFFAFTSTLSLSDAAEPWQFGFQDPATPIMEGIINFHNHIMFFLTVIGIMVMWLMARCVILYDEDVNTEVDNFTHSTTLEIVWTVVPAIVLMVIAVPSFALLYSMDEMLDPAITLKVIGHQWYWSYEYSDYDHLLEEDGERINFDSYMTADDDLSTDPSRVGAFRLLEVDNRVVLPVNTHVRVLVTSADVLHSWAVPAFGVKVDACPGRLNQTSVFIKREGTFYGQCSEICGVNHGFMPIAIEARSLEDYTSYLETKLELE